MEGASRVAISVMGGRGEMRWEKAEDDREEREKERVVSKQISFGSFLVEMGFIPMEAPLS